jgi:hypothetical protein
VPRGDEPLGARGADLVGAVLELGLDDEGGLGG